jgi:hypothetical protein
MNMKTRSVIFALVLVAGLFLVGCGPIPAGAEIKVNPDGKSAQVEFAGIVDSIAADLWVVAGQALVISPLSILDSSILTGDMVKVHATVTLDGTVNADSISPYTPKHASPPEASLPADDKETEFTGVVEVITPETWVVSGMTFSITLQTEIAGTIIVGDQVKIEARLSSDGISTAQEIKLAGAKTGLHQEGTELEFSGIVELISPESWTIAGQVFAISPKTEIKGTIIVGDLVKVEALVGMDGTATAHEIKLADGSDPSTEDDSELEFEGIVETIAPDNWTVAGQTFTITPETEIKGTILVGDLVKIEGLVGTDGTAIAREIKLAEVKNNSPEDESRVEFIGVVESIGLDSWTVGGQVFAITPQTEIKGTIIAGDTVKIEALNNPDGTLTADEIKKTGSHGLDNQQSESDDHSSTPGNGRSSDNSSEHGSNPGGGPSTEEDDD